MRVRLTKKILEQLRECAQKIEDESDPEVLLEEMSNTATLFPVFMYELLCSLEEIPPSSYLPFVQMGNIDQALSLFLIEYSQERGGDEQYDKNMKDRFLKCLPDFHKLDNEMLEVAIQTFENNA